MDHLELQLAMEKVHECNSKKCLTELKKQFEKFLANTSDFKNEERIFNEFLQRNNYVVNTQGFKDGIIRYQNGIEKGIDARSTHEEVLRIKERDVKERMKKERHNILINLMDSLEKAIAERGLYKRVHNSRVNEITMQTRKGMIKNDASEIDNNVAGAFHDRDKIHVTSKELQQELTEEINQLLEANIANDVRNLVMHSYVEIKNKEELERFSKESKDSNKFCNDVVEVKEKLSK
ncbi:hypothetical protein Tco_0111994 [Tanacetum coccineum]